jgi:DNA repair exonuclease SbcCD ATPase subunit
MQSIERDASRQISEKLQAKEDNIKEVDRDIKKIQDDMKDWSNTVETNNNRIKSFNARKKEIQDSWKNEPKTISFDDKDAACPTCHRPFDEEYLEEKKEETIKEFNTRLQKKMQTMTEEGQSLNKKIKDLEAENENLEADIEQGHGILASKRAEVESIKQSPAGVQTTQGILKDNAEYQHMKEALSKVEEKLSNVTSGVMEGDAELKKKKLELQEERDKLIAQLNTKYDIEKANTRVKELEQEEQKLNDQISAYEKDEYLIEEFVKLKVDTYEKPINELFENVKFKLFDVQMNGGISETCEAMVNGVPWALANTAAKVQTGIEIINRLADYNNMYTPFFIDGRESVIEIPETKSQVINLIVKEGIKPLKIQ